MTTRRAFLGTIAGGLLAAPFAVEAQQVSNPPRVGFLAMGHHPSYPVFTQALRDLGYIDGRSIVLEPRFAPMKRPVAASE